MSTTLTTALRYTVTDLILATNVPSRSVYRYLANYEATHNVNMRDANGNWSLTKRVFDRVVSSINRQRSSI